MNMPSPDRSERRRYPRIESVCLITYEEKEGSITQSPLLMARSLNFSLTGAKFETIEALPTNCTVELGVAVRDDIFSVRGKIVYCRQMPDGHYHVGIHFDRPAQAIMGAVSG